MQVTESEVNHAISKYLLVGIDTSVDISQGQWDDWRQRLQSCDISAIVNLCIKKFDSLDCTVFSDPWLLTLLECLEEISIKDIDIYIDYANSFKSSKYLLIFLSIAGKLFSDHVIIWLMAIQREKALSIDEVMLTAQAYWQHGSPLALQGIRQLISQQTISENNKLNIINDMVNDLVIRLKATEKEKLPDPNAQD